MPLEFPEDRAVTLSNVQCRVEHHGEDLVPAVDLGITYKGHPQVLDAFAPGLRAALFTDDKPGESDALDLTEGSLPYVRAKKLKLPVGIDHEQTGMRCTVRYGTGGKSDVVLDLVKLSKVKVAAITDGPACELRFTLSCAQDITDVVAGRLAMLQGHEIEIVLEAAKVEEDTQTKRIDAEPSEPANWPIPKDTRQTPAEAFAAHFDTPEDQ